MGKITGNEPATPQWDMTFDKNPNTDLFSAGTSTGLTIRQEFAARAMQGYISAGSDENNRFSPHQIASMAVSQADMLIAELNK